MNTFDYFNEGKLLLPDQSVDFGELEWHPHPTFEGVALKHIVTSKETDGAFSYHLVKIEPNCSIKNHIHETQLETHEIISGEGVCVNDGVEIPYQRGTISIMPAGVEHEVNAGDEGLFMFAKFIPALC